MSDVVEEKEVQIFSINPLPDEISSVFEMRVYFAKWTDFSTGRTYDRLFLKSIRSLESNEIFPLAELIMEHHEMNTFIVKRYEAGKKP